MEPRRTIVFDLDGTLVDSMGGFTAIASDVIRKHFGLSETDAAAAYRRTSGLPFAYQLRSLFPGHPRIAEAEREYETRKLEDYGGKAFYPDVAPALESLSEAGHRLCVSSNNHAENVATKLAGHESRFTEILGYRPGFLKGRDHFRYLRERYAIGPSNLLFIGDSLNDARVARSDGIPFVARLGTFTAEDFAGLGFPVLAVSALTEVSRLIAEDGPCAS